MVKQISFIVLALLAIACTHEHPKDPQYKIVGYVAGFNAPLDADKIEAEKLTHINYAFANIKNGEVVNDLQNDAHNYAELQKLRKRNPQLKILVSIGGWTWSGNFSDAALTAASREKFANSAVAYMKTWKLDGIDIDWEYPGLPGAGNVYRKADKENFTLLLKALREKLDQEGKKDNKAADDPYLLTIATGANVDYLHHVEMLEVQKYCSFINIMGYDFAGGWDSATAHHTNLFHPPDEKNIHSAYKAVFEHVNAGVPLSKLVLGVAFYGRGWSDVNPDNNGLYQKGKGDMTHNYSFDTLYMNLIDKHGYRRLWDGEAKAPYLWNDSLRIFISYEDEESIKEKAFFIKEKKLGGAMFWEYSSDHNGILLEQLYKNLK